MTRYVRYARGDTIAYGVEEGATIRELDGDPFSGPRATGATVPISDVRLLAPCTPSKIIAVGLNYRSHLGGRPAPEYPGVFAKLPSAVIGPDEAIVIPEDAREVHYEGELVVAIGKRAKNVSMERARDCVFGVTAGNDVSERVWQRGDLQWVRAKASDTFAPIGPAIVSGLNYNDLLVQTRVNGEARQAERTRDMLFDVDTVVAYISRYVTLLPGDLIFTGTPGTTTALQPGDVVEVEVEGVGVLRNHVAAAGPE
ncbi:MAG: fumarylacetoacetate hydrolase family protein [Gemmatimonadota bacterium]|nr:MAG: fumarylacetoacetate hydrolase family protein [Gemmatimonadota bacterium]